MTDIDFSLSWRLEIPFQGAAWPGSSESLLGYEQPTSQVCSQGREQVGREESSLVPPLRAQIPLMGVPSS